MLIINSASATGAAYWQRSAVHSHWLGQGASLLGLSGEVETVDLRSVMLGQRPRAGAAAEPLTSRPGLRRRHGWDLIFAAPKSVSLLADAGAAPVSPELREAYRRAVGDAVSTLEERAAWLRAAGAQVQANGVVAAAFEHLANDAGHPHLHSHVVLANLAARGEGGWGCLVGRELWRWREGLGAGFHLALRSRLAEAGFGFKWELADGGLGEIVAVPMAARMASSSRSRGLRAAARSFGSGSSATERASQVRTRQGTRVAGPELTGWGPAQAAQVLKRAMAEPASPSPPPATAPVAVALAARGSAFEEPDVLVALAETAPGGLNLKQAADWARKMCDASQPLRPGRDRGRRWTTELAHGLDQRVVDLAMEARFSRIAQVMPSLAEGELAELGTPAEAGAEAMRLACGPEGVAIVPRGPWLAQAACIDAARAAWQAAGVTVRLACPSELAARRWRALTSLSAHGGTGVSYGAPAGLGRADRVLVVDAADHLSPRSLVDVVARATSDRTKVVLVLGGTVPGRGPSVARSLDQLSEGVSGLGPALLPPAWSPVVAGAANPKAANPAISLGGIAVQGALTGADAMAHILKAWAGTARFDRVMPLMVAFGPAEAEALNLAGRPLWLQLRGRQLRAGNAELPAGRAEEEVVLGERAYAVGDRVVALRRIGRVTSATFGSVVSLEGPSLTVEWQGVPAGRAGGRGQVGPDEARSLGYGYATTVPYLRSCGDGTQPFVVLGDPLELAARSPCVAAAWVTVPGPGWPTFGANGWADRHRAALSELATSWPNEEMLELAGPRPLSLAARRRWAEVVVSCAVRRELGLAELGLDATLTGARSQELGPGAPLLGERSQAKSRAPTPYVPGL